MLTAQENAEIQHVHAMGSEMSTSTPSAALLSGVVALGEGRRRLSWIWYASTGSAEGGNDWGMQDGRCPLQLCIDDVD